MDISEFSSIIKVSKFDPSEICNNDYSVEEVDGTLFRIEYIINRNNKAFILMNIGMAAALLLTIGVFIYIGQKVIKPFDKMSSLTQELAKGNLSTPIKEEKSRFFGKFLWGMDMLRENLEDSKTTLFSFHSNDPNVGMSLTKDISKYKIYCADTGLFITLAFWDKDYTENEIYQKLLNDKLSTNLGYVYENVIAQILASTGDKLFYYTWSKDVTHNYEIDFLLSRGSKLCPVEVKSSGYNTHKSLDAFCDKFSSRVGERYLIYTKDYRKDGATTLLPVFMTMFL